MEKKKKCWIGKKVFFQIDSQNHGDAEFHTMLLITSDSETEWVSQERRQVSDYLFMNRRVQ